MVDTRTRSATFSRRSAAVRLQRVVVLLVVAGLAGCASRPHGTLLPVAASVPGTSSVDMLVATTRAKSSEPGVFYSGQRGETLSVDNIVVSIPPEQNRKIGEVNYPRSNPGDPLTEFVARKVEPVTQSSADAWYRRVKGKEGNVFIFIHGFNTTYEEAVFRFAQIVHDTGADAAPLLFTWPSQGSIFDYLYDRESANFSRSALADIIERTARDPRVDNITIMAHSMGTWLTMEALDHLAIRDSRLSPKIRTVILASPDLDVDVFGKQLDDIDTSKTQFTIFTSTDDRALAVSRRLAGGIQRLGAIDIMNGPYRREIENHGVDVIDLSQLKAGSSLNHDKFVESPRIVQLIGDRLLQGQEITENDLSIGDALGAAALGTAQTVGSAAGAIVTAPGALVSEDGRRSFETQVNNVGRNLGGTIQTAVGQ